jgi:hypothetical protein
LAGHATDVPSRLPVAAPRITRSRSTGCCHV